MRRRLVRPAHAATGYAGGPLSHLSALAVHGLAHEATRLHVTVRETDRLRSSRLLRVHRTSRPPVLAGARGLPTTTVPRALVETWGDAHRTGAVRGYADVAGNAVLQAVRERLVTADEVAAELAALPRLPGRAALRDLVSLVRGGARSWLEVSAARGLLDVPGLPPCTKQFRVLLPDGPVLLDAAWPEVRLAVELDGAAFHAGPRERERDLRRDAALAALGWLTLRFSYLRATGDADACRAQIAAVYRARLIGVP
ncbi:DUF559 domain-containing protein [Geodermatophilus marinus]|uniref:DUF559 domain-containing protein n=1 Tax=Geodermatophilus sp. LHW52908 TaxID=2303986 RepID=UPI001314C6D2|nr:DUF559 domain-containing protein [Geodermatophilus sp. LHW52908]